MLGAIARGEFDAGDDLRAIVNAARLRAESRTRRLFPIGSHARIDCGGRQSQWDGVVGIVVKANGHTVKLETRDGLVTVPISMIAAS